MNKNRTLDADHVAVSIIVGTVVAVTLIGGIKAAYALLGIVCFTGFLLMAFIEGYICRNETENSDTTTKIVIAAIGAVYLIVGIAVFVFLV